METNTCKTWKGARDKDGYGFVKIKGKQMRVHRVAKEIDIGRRLKTDEHVLHLCNNPPCYESTHLIIGDNRQNQAMRRNDEMSLADTYLDGWRDIY